MQIRLELILVVSLSVVVDELIENIYYNRTVNVFMTKGTVSSVL